MVASSLIGFTILIHIKFKQKMTTFIKKIRQIMITKGNKNKNETVLFMQSSNWLKIHHKYRFFVIKI